MRNDVGMCFIWAWQVYYRWFLFLSSSSSSHTLFHIHSSTLASSVQLDLLYTHIHTTCFTLRYLLSNILTNHSGVYTTA
jgi:hypothetical protein